MRNVSHAVSIPAEFQAETSSLVLSRTRVGIVLAITMVIGTAPLDYFRLPESITRMLLIRTATVLALSAILPLTFRKRLEPWASGLAGVALFVDSAFLVGVARFASGPSDPLYLVQIMGLIFVIMSIGLLLPIDGRTAFRLALIPFALHVATTVQYDPIANLPTLCATFAAAVVATVGAEIAYRTRLGEYTARRAREDFTAMLSHDIKNPLASVAGYVEMLRDIPGRSSEEEDLLNGIEAANAAAMRLTTNFLELSRIEAGQLVVRRSATELRELVRRSLEGHRARIRMKSLRVVEDLDATDGVVVEVDAALVERALANLLDNAIRLSPAAATIRVTLRRQPNGAVEMAIADEGPGIDPEVLRHLFQRYQRGPSRGPSTGLGLFIVKTIVEAHGGRVSAENGPKGAVFRVRLPSSAAKPREDASASVIPDRIRRAGPQS